MSHMITVQFEEIAEKTYEKGKKDYLTKVE
jgi:hypothetical protein